MFVHSVSILLFAAALTPPDPALDALIAEAVRTAPEAVSARKMSEASQLRVDSARLLPDPMASLGFQSDGNDLMLSQTLPWPGKLGLSGRAAASEAQAVEIALTGRAGRSIAARVRRAWYELALARSVDRLIEARREAAANIEAAVRARYEAGRSEQQDVLRAQVEVARLEEMKAMQQALIVARTADLNRLLGRPHDQAIASPDSLPTPSDVPGAIVAEIVAGSPEISAARVSLDSRRTRVDLARRNFFPDVVVSAGSMVRSYEMGTMWQASVAFSIPAWIGKRQARELAATQAEAEAAQAELNRTIAELELATRTRLAELAAVTKIVSLYRDRIIPLDELALESALASYQSGRLPFVSVLDALNTLYSDRTTLQERLAEALKLRVAIDEANL